jgi:hypothetical protein
LGIAIKRARKFKMVSREATDQALDKHALVFAVPQTSVLGSDGNVFIDINDHFPPPFAC